MFRVMRNSSIRETELLRALNGELGAALPADWSLTSATETRNADTGVDAVFALAAPDGTTGKALVEAKRVVEPRDVPRVVRELKSYGTGACTALVVAAPYLSPRVRDLLRQDGVGWFDSTGNLRFQLGRPSVFIDRTGASRSPFTDAEDRRLKSLKGPGAARVVRALLDEALLIRVRALATAADVGAATSSRVLELLVREDLVLRAGDGSVTDVRKRSLVRRWSEDYGLSSSNQAIPMLAARGIDKVIGILRTFEGTYAMTGEAASRPYLPRGQVAVAPLALLTIYVPDAGAVADALQLRPVDRGANVVLVEPFDSVVYRGAQVKKDLTYVAPSQAVVDLLTGPGRAPEEGASLIEALAANDEAWTR